MKPSDLTIGLINFLSVLLPGAIATSLLLHISPGLSGLLELPPGPDILVWIIAFAAAYFVGHLIFLVGSWLDPLYDFVRRRRDPYAGDKPPDASRLNTVADFLLRKRKLRPRPGEPEKLDKSWQAAEQLRERVTTAAERNASNTFKWCRAILIQNSPAAHQDIEIHEADQKLFRSLVVLALGITVGAAIALEWQIAGIALAAAIVSFMRYYNRRLKTVQLAYIHILVLYRCGGVNFRPIENESPRA